MTGLTAELQALAEQARAAYRVLALADPKQKNAALLEAAKALRAAKANILAANKQDLDGAKELSEALRDRLLLNDARVEAMARAIEQVAELPDPVGRVLDSWDVKHNGLHIEKVAIPLGVIGMIYESRPNVTADAAALCIKSGNAVILRGGTESFHSSAAIAKAMQAGLAAAKLPITAVQLVPTTDRAAVGALLAMPESIDVIIPRGGQSLTERVQKESRVPTLLHLEGNCHIYVHAQADLKVARSVVHNAKLRRTGICGALESLLIDKSVLASHGAPIVKDLLDADCEVRGDEKIMSLDKRVKQASEEDWSTEYLAPILSAKVVNGIDAAIAHINRYGSHHTDAIITAEKGAGERFVREVDSAIVLINASTQFADGGEFGFGAEIGIATGRLHARGPVGAAQLVTYKYIVTTKKPEGATRAG